MGFCTSPDISISLHETSEKENGKRCIDGFKLEISNSIPRHIEDGRSDYFEGVGYKLTLEQAEELHKQLGKGLAFIKPLISNGQVNVKS